MRLEQVAIRNLRLFGQEEQVIQFESDKNITILLGDNGAGKTSVLYGCTVVLSNFFSAFPYISNKTFAPGDVKVISNSKKADYLHVGIRMTTEKGNTIVVDQYKKGNSNATPKTNLSELKEYASTIKAKIDADECVSMPILAYYGTERGQIQAPERRRDFNTVFPRWDSYSGSLEPATNFKRFFTWFERNEDEERRKQIELKDFSYRSFVLSSVRDALSKIDLKLQNPRVLTSPLRFVMDDVSGVEGPKEVRIERMSDGYRIMVAMVADIAARMAEANPSFDCSGLKSPLEAPGIVFIDEIDLHLHPLWQRKVLRQLRMIFPNVQFIVTTHSPNVVMGALDIVQVVKLEDGKINANVDLEQYMYNDVSQLLLSSLFDLKNVRTEMYHSIIEERKQLIDKDSLTIEERTRLTELDHQVSLYDPCEGGELRRARELLEQLSQNIKSTRHD